MFWVILEYPYFLVWYNRHCILNSLWLGLPFPNDSKILNPKIGLGPDQIINWLKKSFYGKYNSFINKISYFWKIKVTETLGAVHTHTPVCVCRFHVHVRVHEPAYIARVLEVMKDKFFYIKTEVWGESHIVWKPFQTPVFSI